MYKTFKILNDFIISRRSQNKLERHLLSKCSSLEVSGSGSSLTGLNNWLQRDAYFSISESRLKFLNFFAWVRRDWSWLRLMTHDGSFFITAFIVIVLELSFMMYWRSTWPFLKFFSSSGKMLKLSVKYWRILPTFAGNASFLFFGGFIVTYHKPYKQNKSRMWKWQII